jgi:small nuclear ribonucleoprotein (snRNP)-like protein
MGYDPLLNLVLDHTIEYQKGNNNNNSNNSNTYIHHSW